MSGEGVKNAKNMVTYFMDGPFCTATHIINDPRWELPNGREGAQVSVFAWWRFSNERRGGKVISQDGFGGGLPWMGEWLWWVRIITMVITPDSFFHTCITSNHDHTRSYCRRTRFFDRSQSWSFDCYSITNRLDDVITPIDIRTSWRTWPWREHVIGLTV